MSSNVISINNWNKIDDKNKNDLVWVVPDSKMEELIDTLDKLGDRHKDV